MIYYTYRKSIGVSCHDSGLRNNFLDVTAKHRQPKKKTDKPDVSKLKTFVLQGKASSGKTTHSMGENFHKSSLTRDLYLEYTKNSHNLPILML